MMPCGSPQLPQRTASLPGWPLSTAPMKREGESQASCDRKTTQNLHRRQHMMRESGCCPFQMIRERDMHQDIRPCPLHVKGLWHCRLDVMPATILKFRGNGDEATARLLEDTIYKVLSAPPPDSQALLR